MIFRAAVQSGSEDAGNRSLSDAPMSAENVAVGGASLLDRVLEGAGDVFLSDDLGELLRTVFAGEDGVGHAAKFRLYVMNFAGKLVKSEIRVSGRF
jgi:hypothetical protein